MKSYLQVALLTAAASFAGLMIWMNPAQAQAPADGKGKAPNAAKAGAPKQIGMEDGLTYFQTKCMSCHAETKAKAATARKIRDMSAEAIYEVISKVGRPEHDQGLTDPQKRRLAEFMGGYRPLGAAAAGNPSSFGNRCPANAAMSDPTAGPAWSGWGVDGSNNRYQTAEAAGITAAQVPNLKLKWAFGFPMGITAWEQPAVAGGRVYVGADTGWIYSLDAKTGCVHWGYQTGTATRPAISIGPVTGKGSSKYAVYFGDAKANVYAVDAQNGELLWKKHVEDFFLARITASPKLYNGKLYVPVSSSEEWQSGNPDYECCTSRGSVVALDASTGNQVWKTYVMEDPKPTKKNPNGVQLYGPAGGSVWNSPTIDPVRNAIYFGTGDTETEPPNPNGDGIMALDLTTGKKLWVYQATPNDSFMGGCFGQAKSLACPEKMGPDSDIGNSPMLRSLANGKRVLINGTKEGDVFALDPDDNGKLLWRVKANTGGRGGIVWGGATDHENAYFGFSAGGFAALKLATGERAWFNAINPPGGRGGHGAAATVIPGVVFASGADGKMTAMSTVDGKILWQYETAHDFETVNRVAGANGGTISSAGPVLAGGMMFISSGNGVGGGSDFGNVLLAFGVE